RRDLGGLPRPVETCRQRPLPGRSDRVDVEVDRRWLAAQWRFVKDHLPAAPARVLELGCGPRGGFVPALRNDRYTAVGVDPEAPDEPGYHRTGFEDYRPPQPVDAVVACTSLHHVADLDQVLDRLHDSLTAGGVLVVVEWARECFDEPTARWCFARLRRRLHRPGRTDGLGRPGPRTDRVRRSCSHRAHDRADPDQDRP